MRTNSFLLRDMNRLRKMAYSICDEGQLNLHFADASFEAEQLREVGRNFRFALNDAMGALHKSALRNHGIEEGGAV